MSRRKICPNGAWSASSTHRAQTPGPPMWPSIAIASMIIQPYVYTTDELRKIVDAHHEWPADDELTFTPCGRIRNIRVCFSPARRRACLFPSTTARTGSRCSSICPSAPVHDLAIHGDDLIVATHGRAFWILDDISPLREITDAIQSEDVHLYASAAAVRFFGGSYHIPPELAAWRESSRRRDYRLRAEIQAEGRNRIRNSG